MERSNKLEDFLLLHSIIVVVRRHHHRLTMINMNLIDYSASQMFNEHKRKNSRDVCVNSC